METFSIGGALSWGWTQFKARPWFYVGVMLIVFIISAALGALGDPELVGDDLVAGITSILGVIVQWWIWTGLIGLLLAAHDGKPLSVSQLFEQGGRTLWHYAIGTILYALIILGGIILLIFPAIVWGIKFHYYSFLVVDKSMPFMEALKRSAEITKGYKWDLLGFFIVVGLVNLAGALVLLVGLLVTMPVTFLAIVCVYRWLESNAPAMVEEVSQQSVSQEQQGN